MRKITETIANAFSQGTNKTQGNTEVLDGNVYLHLIDKFFISNMFPVLFPNTLTLTTSPSETSTLKLVAPPTKLVFCAMLPYPGFIL